MASGGSCLGERSDDDGVDLVACEGCTVAVQVGPDGSVVTETGDRGRVTYADEALRVWDCPGCRFTNAEDRLG
jgi:hypothetical protein